MMCVCVYTKVSWLTERDYESIMHVLSANLQCVWRIRTPRGTRFPVCCGSGSGSGSGYDNHDRGLLVTNVNFMADQTRADFVYFPFHSLTHSLTHSITHSITHFTTNIDHWWFK